MKLKRQPVPIERTLRSVEALSPTLSAELSLQEKIGLPPRMEEYLRKSLEIRVPAFDVMVRQTATAVHLITLFPAEAEEFIRRLPIDRLIPLVENNMRGVTPTGELDRGTVSAVYWLSQVAPEKTPQLPVAVAEHRMRMLNWDTVPDLLLEWAAEAVQLFPDRAEAVKKMTEPLFDQAMQISEIGMNIMRYILYVDPSTHARLHEFALSHQTELKAFFKKIARTGAAFNIDIPASLFATYTLLLADDVKKTATGILVPVKRGKIATARPLPARSSVV